MDPRIQEWQRQAQEAYRLNPDAKDAIEAHLRELMAGLPATWANEAQAAVNVGAPRDKVQAHFKELVESHGFTSEQPIDYGSLFAQERAPEFANVKSGVESARNIEEERRLAREALTDDEKVQADVQSIWSNLKAGGAEISRGVLGIAGGLVDAAGQIIDPVSSGMGANPAQGASDWLFEQSQEAGRSADVYKAQAPIGAASGTAVAGAIPPKLFGGFLADQFNKGADVLDKGGSLLEAEVKSAKQGGVNLLGVASGMLGSQAPGLAAMASRAAVQVPANIGLGVVDRYADDVPTTGGDVAMDAAFGAFGSLFRNPTKAKVDEPTPSVDIKPTGIPAVDAGKAAAQATFDNVKIDLDAPFKVEIPTIKRQAPSYEESPPTTTNVGDMLEGVPARETTDIAIPETEVATPPQAEGVNVTFRNEEPVYPQRGEVVKLGRFDATTGEPISRGKPKKAPVTLESLRQEAAAGRAPLFEQAKQPGALLMAGGDGSRIVAAGAPEWLQRKLSEGSLTARDVLKEGQKFVDTDPVLKKESANLIRYVSALADRIGGNDVKFNILDPNNPAHAEVLNRQKANLEDGNYSAFYDPRSNAIYMKPITKGFNTMVHEAVHGITSKLIWMGSEGMLKGPAQAAYTNMSNLFEQAIKPELAARAATLPPGIARSSREYGLTNLSEFYSEFFANGVFRKSLKDLEVTPEWIQKQHPVVRGIIQGARNLYDVAVKSISKMLGRAGIRTMADIGGGDKASNAYEHMFARMDDFHNKISDADARALRENSQRNTDQGPADMSFLGEQVAQRGPQESPAPIQAPRSRLVQAAKAALAGRGVEPLVTLAKEQLAGAKQEARLMESIRANKAVSILEKLGPSSRAVAQEKMATIFRDSSAPEAQAAFDSLRQVSPELAKLSQDLVVDRYNNSMAMFDELLRSQEGKANPDPKVLAFAQKYLENRYKYEPIVYQSKEATQAKHKLALKAQEKLNSNKLLSKEEQKALAEYNNLAAWVGDNVYGDKVALEKLQSDNLRALYNDTLGETDKFRGLPAEDVRAAMIEELAHRNATLDNRTQAIKDTLAQISEVGNNTNGVAQYYAGLKYGKDTLKAIQDVPLPIREWWGQLRDPLVNQIKGVGRQSMQLAEMRALNGLREKGMGTLFTDQPGMGGTERLSGESYGSLENLYTTPDVKVALDTVVKFGVKPETIFDAMVQRANSEQAFPAITGKILTHYMGLVRKAKTAVTVGSMGNWLRNLAGSPAQMLSNGNISPASYRYGIDAVTELLNLSGKKDITDEARRMVRLGLAEATQISETYSPRTKRNMDKLLKLLGESPEKADTFLRKMAAKGGQSLDVAKELYGAMDLWTKFANFKYEKDFWSAYNKKRGIEMSEDALDQMVADRIKQTNISYSRSPLVLKYLDAYGGTNFINYWWETFRTTANNYKVGTDDVFRGFKEGDNALISHGIKRLLGNSAAVGATSLFFTGAVKGGLAALGFAASDAGDKEEMKEYMKDSSLLDPDYTAMFKDSTTGQTWGIDGAMFNPYDPVWSVVKEAKEAALDPANAGKHLDRAKKAVVDSWGRSGMVRAITGVAQGRTPGIAKTFPELYEELMQKGIDSGLSVENVDRAIIAADALTPKTVEDIYKASTKNVDTNTKGAIASGLGAQSVSPSENINNYQAGKFRADLNAARTPLSDLMKAKADVSPERLESEFKTAMKSVATSYGKLKQAYDAAEASGEDLDNLYEVLTNKASEDVADQLESGEDLPALLIYQDMEKQMEKDIDAAKTDEEAQKIEDRWMDKLDSLEAILTKYENISVDDIKKGALDG